MCGKTDLHPKLAVLLVFWYSYVAIPAVEERHHQPSRFIHCPWEHPTHPTPHARQSGNSTNTKGYRTPKAIAWRRKEIETNEATPTSPRRARSPPVAPPFPTDSPASLGATLLRRPHPCTQIDHRVRVVLFGCTSCLPRTRRGV